MNNKILLSSALLVASLGAFAQSGKNSLKTYAITGDGSHDYIWMNIRQVDLNTGQVIRTLFDRSQTPYVMTDIQSKQSFTQASTLNTNIFASTEFPTGTLVAAAAYDPQTNKLFFTPMRNGELRWLDLNEKSATPHFYTLKSETLRQANPMDEALNITRMVIGADGYGYALSNDGNRFLRFTTGQKPAITELGNIIDAEGKNGVSIHNKCTSWGGDMVADAFGKLYVISANHNIFKINPETRIAEHLGTIKGLPAGYTTNAAAVDRDGMIVLASANKFDGYYKMKIDDLAAVKMEGSDSQFNPSDLANGVLLLQKEADAARQYSMGQNQLPVFNTAVSAARVFPNPVVNNSFSVLFEDMKDGRYSIVLTDLAGRILQTRSVSVAKGSQAEKITLSPRSAKGVYMVKVLNENQEQVMVEKVIVQ